MKLLYSIHSAILIYAVALQVVADDQKASNRKGSAEPIRGFSCGDNILYSWSGLFFIAD